MAVLELVHVPLGCGAKKGKKWKFESKKYDWSLNPYSQRVVRNRSRCGVCVITGKI